MTVPILILAGGSSSRMGSRNKLLEDVDGQPLLRLQAQRALATGSDVTVVIRPDAPEVARSLDGLPVHVLEAPEACEGMGGSIRAGIGHLQKNDAVLVMLADLVELEPDDLRAVMAASAHHPGKIWRGATDDGKPGHPILFDHSVFPALLALRGGEGGQTVIRAFHDDVCLIALPDQRARRDLDTPEAWDAWRAERS